MGKVPVKKIADLSKLILTEQEEVVLSEKLDETVSYVENLNELDTSKTPPTSSPTGTLNRYFEDGLPNNRKLKSGKYIVRRIIS
ncbi:MAG: Asp-tRNA(Asn)/Glu-tRNA(Gln) amidotransferase subunit GatC [Patescibacteria group bacterium]